MTLNDPTWRELCDGQTLGDADAALKMIIKAAREAARAECCAAVTGMDYDAHIASAERTIDTGSATVLSLVESLMRINRGRAA